MAGENLGQPVSRAPGTRARGQREQVALLGCVCVCVGSGWCVTLRSTNGALFDVLH